MKKALLFFILFSSVMYAADTADIIWTWGNGKSIAAILSFIYYLVNIDTMAILIKYSAIIGFFVITMRELARGTAFTPQAYTLKIGFFFVAIYIIVNGFLTVSRDDQHKVYILSANELSAASWAKCRPVNGSNDCYAPIAIKLLYTAATNIERSGIGMMESAMMDANALTYSFSRMGLGFGFSFYDTVSKNKGDPYTYNTFMEYYENCIIYDLADGTKTVDGLYKSNDLSNYILSTNSRLTNVYSASNPSGTLKTCYEVSSQNLWGNITCQNTASKVQAKSKGTASSEGTTDDICEAAQNFGQTMFNSTKDASAQIEQRTIMNLTNEAIVNSAVASGIDPNTLAYGTAMADREQTAKWMTMGIMAKEWIPSIRGMTQGIALGLTWALAILSIMTANPAPYIGSVIGFQVTLTVWSFILALINFMTIDRMTDVLPNIFISDLGNVDQMTLWSQPTFDEENQKALAFLGYMAVASYGVAQGLVKIGGNALASLGSAIGQLSVGMGTSANMAKGHFDGGLDKSDSSGSSHVNRFGDHEQVNPSGFSRTQTNQSGMGSKTTTRASAHGGNITEEEQTNANGSSSLKASTSDGRQSVSIDKSGKVVDANISGIDAKVGETVGHEIENARGKSAELSQTGSKTLSSAIQNSSTAAQEFIQGVSNEKGTTAGTEVAKSYNEQVQNNLQKAFEKGQISDDTYQKLRSIDYSAGAEVKASAKGGFEIFGTGVSTSGTASVGVNAKSTGQHGHNDTITLGEKDAEVLSKSMATGLSATAKTTEGVSARLADSTMQKSSESLTKTHEASSSFSQSAKLAETASKMEKDKEAITASVSKDIMFNVAQKLVDNMGFERGTDELFHNKDLVERTTKQVISESSEFKKVDTDSVFNSASSGVHGAKNNTSSIETGDPRTTDIQGQYSNNNGKVSNKGESYLNNMPEISNPPTHQDTQIQTRVESNQYNHSNGSISLLANPTESIIDSSKEIGKELIKDANFKISADGTYTDREGLKHNWSNKGNNDR